VLFVQTRPSCQAIDTLCSFFCRKKDIKESSPNVGPLLQDGPFWRVGAGVVGVKVRIRAVVRVVATVVPVAIIVKVAVVGVEHSLVVFVFLKLKKADSFNVVPKAGMFFHISYKNIQS